MFFLCIGSDQVYDSNVDMLEGRGGVRVVYVSAKITYQLDGRQRDSPQFSSANLSIPVTDTKIAVDEKTIEKGS
jgi:hypothetical protein